MHVAIFDAVNSIEGRYRPYYVQRRRCARRVSGSRGRAGRARHAAGDDADPEREIPRGADGEPGADLPAAAAADGAAVGAAVARAILDLRRNDGWSRTPPEYVLPAMAGYWQPTPPNNPSATLTHYPDVVSFGLDGSQHFVPAPTACAHAASSTPTTSTR